MGIFLWGHDSFLVLILFLFFFNFFFPLLGFLELFFFQCSVNLEPNRKIIALC